MVTAAEIDIVMRVKGDVEKHLKENGAQLRQIGEHAKAVARDFSGLKAAAGSVVDTLGKVGLAGMGLKVVVDAAKGLGAPIQMASDLGESMNKVDVLFGQSAQTIKEFSSTAFKNLGMSKGEALAAAGQFGNLFKTIGLGERDVTDMSQRILTLGADLGSFHNMMPTEALEKLRAGLIGEAEPLRSMGILLTEDAVKAKGLALGLADAKGELSEAAKVQARYALILEQSKNAHGDFANTATGMANAQRIISAGFTDIVTQIGGAVLPAIAPLVSQFAQTLPAAMAALGPAITTVGKVFGDLVNGGISLAQQAFTALEPAITTIMAILPDLGTAFSQAFAFASSGGGDIEVFRGVLNRLLGPEGAQGVIEAFTNLVGFVRNDLIPAFQTAGSIINQALSGDLAGALSRVGEIVKTVAPAIGQALLTWGQQFVEFIAPFIPPLLAEAAKLAAQFAAWAADQAPKIAAVLVQWGKELAAWVAPMIPPLLAELGKAGLALLGWVQQQAPVWGQQLLVAGQEFWKWVQPQILPTLAELAKFGLSVGLWLGQFALDMAGKFFTEVLPSFLGWLVEVAPKALKALEDFQRALGRWIVNDAAPWLLKQAWEIGGAIIRGIWEGQERLRDWLTGKVLGMLDGLLKAATGRIDAHSPSKVWADEIGIPITQGIALGVLLGRPDLQAAVATVLDFGASFDDTEREAREAGQRLAVAWRDGIMEDLPEWDGVVREIKDFTGPAFDDTTNVAREAGQALVPVLDELVPRTEALTEAQRTLNAVYRDELPVVVMAAINGPLADLADMINYIRRAIERAIDAWKDLQRRISGGGAGVPSFPGGGAGGPGPGGSGGPSAGIPGGFPGGEQAASRRALTVPLNNIINIDARGMTTNQLTQAVGNDLASIVRQRLVAGVV